MERLMREIGGESVRYLKNRKLLHKQQRRYHSPITRCAAFSAISLNPFEFLNTWEQETTSRKTLRVLEAKSSPDPILSCHSFAPSQNLTYRIRVISSLISRGTVRQRDRNNDKNPDRLEHRHDRSWDEQRRDSSTNDYDAWTH